MPSFSKMGTFPVGYFRATTAWLLRERRDVVARLATLQAEMTRIGFVTMRYRKVKEGDSTKATEQRIGFSVTEGSTLARLIQAYIATGGNPFNISGFLHPESTLVEEGEGGEAVVLQKYPSGGTPGAQSTEYNDPLPESPVEGSDQPEMTGYEGYRGGMVDSYRYTPGRLGSRMDRGTWDSATVLRSMHDIRKWVNKEIKTRLQDKEWRIIKLSDCWEQLRIERDFVLLDAFGGQLIGLPERDDDSFDSQRLCQQVIADLYTLMFDVDTAGIPVGAKENPGLGLLYFAFANKPEDNAGSMG